jgi:uncharacterized protein YlxP (DUF503 family)
VSASAHTFWVKKRTQQFNGGFLCKRCVAIVRVINNLLLKISISAFQEHGRTKRARLSTVQVDSDELQANTETHHSQRHLQAKGHWHAIGHLEAITTT